MSHKSLEGAHVVSCMNAVFALLALVIIGMASRIEIGEGVAKHKSSVVIVNVALFTKVSKEILITCFLCEDLGVGAGEVGVAHNHAAVGEEKAADVREDEGVH